MERSKKTWRMFALILGLLLALAFVLTFAACGDDENQSGGQPEEPDEEEDLSNSQYDDSNTQDNHSGSQNNQSESEVVVPGATDMTPSADEHNESVETDHEFFSNMFESLFSYNYAAVADNLVFTEPSRSAINTYRYVFDGIAYASYDEKDGIIMYSPGMEMTISNYYRYSYEEQYDFSFYGDGSYFYFVYDESDYYPYKESENTSLYSQDYYRYSYDYILDDIRYEFGDEYAASLDDLDDNLIHTTIDIANSFANEFLADYFFEGVTMTETSYGYELDVDFEKMKEANDVLYYTSVRNLIEDALGDDFDNILDNLEKLFDEKVETAVDAILKYGEDYGISKDFIDEIFNLFTEYDSLDEFVNDFDGKDETVAEAFDFNKYEALLYIEEYSDMSLYLLLSNCNYGRAALIYDVMCDNFDSLIHSDTSLIINTYEDGTLISIEFESSGFTITLESDGDYYDDYCSRISGHAIAYFDAVMPTIDSAPAKTTFDGYMEELENTFKDYLKTDSEYVIRSGSNYKYYVTLESGEIMLNYTYNDTTASVPLAETGSIEFYSYYSYDYFYVYFENYDENTGRWWSTSFTLYPVDIDGDNSTGN